ENRYIFFFFFSSRRRHTRSKRDWSSDVCSSDLITESFQWLVNINDLVFSGTIAIVSIFFVYALGVNVAKIYKVDELSSGLVALRSEERRVGKECRFRWA